MSVERFTLGMTHKQEQQFRNLVASNAVEDIEFTDAQLFLLTQRIKGEISHEDALAVALIK